jgi:hypothetical protein
MFGQLHIATALRLMKDRRYEPYRKLGRPQNSSGCYGEKINREFGSRNEFYFITSFEKMP